MVRLDTLRETNFWHDTLAASNCLRARNPLKNLLALKPNFFFHSICKGLKMYVATYIVVNSNFVVATALLVVVAVYIWKEFRDKGDKDQQGVGVSGDGDHPLCPCCCRPAVEQGVGKEQERQQSEKEQEGQQGEGKEQEGQQSVGKEQEGQQGVGKEQEGQGQERQYEL
ncbi:unnamed protein product [Closterium sp. Naga37s-1]|nr:unnamed protein product [Closterium sp. Naga37s-1]